MTRPDKLAYLLEAEHLAGIFAEWPDEMNVALCLDDRGGCEIMVYHKDEGRTVLRKVASVLDRPLSDDGLQTLVARASEIGGPRAIRAVRQLIVP